MKYLVAIVAVVFSSSVFAWGLSWESVSSYGKKVITPHVYNVEAAGNDIRVYEWITETKPHQKCVFVASERNTNLECDIVDEKDVSFPTNK